MNTLRSTLLRLLLAAVALVLPLTAPAQTVDDGPVTTAKGFDTLYVEEIERWWGAVGAVLCGAEIALMRHAPAIGFHPAAIAVGLGGCLLALMDILSTA